jgi:flagellar motility protein MotE (MotC chaperone)
VDKRKHGWHYRIPASATIQLKVGGSARFAKETFIGQHGCVAFMPATTASQKIVSIIELDPISGGLKSSTQGAQASDPGLITRVASASSEVITAERQREKADETASDQVQQLKRKKELLQLNKDIAALEEKEEEEEEPQQQQQGGP